ncbi:5-amino-6-(D-ribitylamino)uracil--L-tyrosine 4-hydroxyphenyl transferase CofH [Zhongshania sp.]|uniref:5-amino-6-(D-ribitylamino)uracil--L-tyrosine 4-hydroxyphenyl transferase CofH n=1 Tax=Zhongshania sp. TaxID=1971902 RepID=UPI001B7AEADA|nr:5-amino-6-(D-ribitylamino)uracil--L-tyrosine 4-hydroxyphenyl transferase CofH [Zhongshania sp.]MBQ0795400.1 5-amino-6-(D-ribitylamino)uracil--L-tyrosine 4-hydroxyphenyl transferase CofH [Zhongshania sp.]
MSKGLAVEHALAAILSHAGDDGLSTEQALALADMTETQALMTAAAGLRDRGFYNGISYSRKVFIPLTYLCRDVCHYCTFAKTPKKIEQAYLPVDDVLAQVKVAESMGCKEALFTLGEKPELRYKAARDALAAMGFASTLEYLAHVAARVLAETNVLPHINAGCMDDAEIAMLRPVSASMGIMLESASSRLCEKGMPHYGSPDKDPALRLETIARAGRASVPFTSGILIGIGETRRERVASLLALRDLHQRYGHIQEIIVQNFRAKPNTKMATAPEPDLNELLWTIAVARLIFGAHMSIQAPPNLSPGVLPQLVAAGLNDWGGVSPLTPDFVNPEAPWPHLENLAQETASAGKFLHERLTIYPPYVRQYTRWLDAALHTKVLQLSDGQGLPKEDDWVAGQDVAAPTADLALLRSESDSLKNYGPASADIGHLIDRALQAEALSEADIVRLFSARGSDFAAVCRAADQLRQQRCGERVSYVVTRNINYTNVCYFKCQFCAFSKGKLSENLRGRPYDLSGEEISRRAIEAWQRGASEVCMQGGIHPEYTGQTYLDIVATLRSATPDMHIHAFSPLEVWQGAETLGLDLESYLQKLKTAGLHTLPGTAAEVLDDEVRAVLCPDKINSEQWLTVMRTAHKVGLRSTATIMYGHVDSYQSWARHLLRVRQVQVETGGFTEFVPLPFVASEAPIYLKGKSRRGPSFREAVLMHAVARLVFNGLIDNIQASWVKMGEQGVEALLNAGVNDLGGTLMNETITRAAGAVHGQETAPEQMEARIRRASRQPFQRNTLYGPADEQQSQRSRVAAPLDEIVNTPANKYERSKLAADEALIAVG